MGVGSFDEEEEYDTDLKCEECLPPVNKQHEVKPIAKTNKKPVAKSTKASAGVSLAALSVSREVTKLRGTAPEEKEEKEEKQEKKEEKKEEKDPFDALNAEIEKP